MDNTNVNLFLLQNLDKIILISSLIYGILIIIFFWLLYKIKVLLVNIEYNTRGNRKINNLAKGKGYTTTIIEDEPQDWACPECKNINKSNSYTCSKCNYSLQ